MIGHAQPRAVERPSLACLRSRLDAALTAGQVRSRRATVSRRGRSDGSELPAVLAGMPRLTGDVLLLTAIGGYTLREAAAVLGCDRAQVCREALFGLRVLGANDCASRLRSSLAMGDTARGNRL